MARRDTADRGLADRIRDGREQLASQAGDRARGLVTQGLERTSETLANVSKMVGDTAAGIEERLGPEYGDYARRAAGAIENAANTIAEKDPDELIEDTRTFVRNSPALRLPVLPSSVSSWPDFSKAVSPAIATTRTDAEAGRSRAKGRTPRRRAHS